MFKKTRLRKAADGGGLIIIGAAIGVLIIIGLYLFSADMMTKNAKTQSGISTAMEKGIEELEK